MKKFKQFSKKKKIRKKEKVYFFCVNSKVAIKFQKKKKKKNFSAENRLVAERVNVGYQYLLIFIVWVSYWHLLIFISGR